jgi:hypothetical protein
MEATRFTRLLIVSIAMLSFAAIAMLALAWQARTIQSLRAGQVTMQQQLSATLAAAWDKVGSSNVDTAQKDWLELIKLRNEVRDLRESLVAERAKHSPSIKEFIRPLLASAAGETHQFRPEWKGMESHASNMHVQALQMVNNGTNEYLRFLYLHTAAKMSLALGRNDDARRFAEDALVLNDKYSRGDAERANGDVVHDANVVLGRIAVAEGRLDEAKRRLLAAGETSGSPNLGSFGPNMGLAKDLLEKGEQATVLDYLGKCRMFWRDKRLEEWKKDIEAGRIPAFGASLLY